MASERFDFTAKINFRLPDFFLHNLILCSVCLIFSRVKPQAAQAEGGKVNSVSSCTATDGSNSFSIYQISAIKT